MKRLVLILALPFFVQACGRGYSDGQRSGTIVKFSEKGLVCKTHEGQMNLGGVIADGAGSVVPNIWEFTVIDPTMVPKIVDAMDARKPVTLVYKQWWWHPSCWTPGDTMDTDYEIVGIK